MELLLIIVSLVLGYAWGHSSGYKRGFVMAHITVADECRKLGKFYVGKTVFTCTSIEEKDKECEKE